MFPPIWLPHLLFSPFLSPSCGYFPLYCSLSPSLHAQRNYIQVLLDQSLTEDQTLSYTLLILLLGYHSILTTLSAATYHLAADPMTQQKLYSELITSVQREVSCSACC